MLNDENKNNDSKILDALISDLKRPLVLIARQAEMESLKEEDQALYAHSIQHTAERTLKLIDSYLLVAQSEYGQKLLPVSTFGIGSVIYDTAQEILPVARKSNIEVVLNVEDALVSASPDGLKAAVWCLSDLVMSQTLVEQNSGVIEIKTKKYEDSLRVSIMSKAMKIKNSDIKKAHSAVGRAHMALSSTGSDNGIRLAIADLIGESMGAKLVAVRNKQAQGIGFNLALSRQMQLV